MIKFVSSLGLVFELKVLTVTYHDYFLLKKLKLKKTVISCFLFIKQYKWVYEHEIIAQRIKLD